MNWDIIQGKWHEMTGTIKEKWGKLTDDDLDVIDGQKDRLVGVLQKRYGYARDQAAKEVDSFAKSCNC